MNNQPERPETNLATQRACPPRQWEREHICDTSILTYRYNMRVGNRLVECTLRYRVERCTEDYVLSDLVHSLTLLPGEEVFLSTRTRDSIARMVDDRSYSASQVSRTSDRVWMETFKNLATDFDQTTSTSIDSESHSSFKQSNAGGGGGINLFGIIKIGGGGSVAKGEFDASSSLDFFNEVNSHFESSYHQTNQISRDTMAVSITNTNSHRELTTESHEELEVSVRRFKNINQCHTVTHYFYQIAKRQRVKITFLGITCRPLNRFANTSVRLKDLNMSLSSNFQANEAAQGQVGIAADQPGLLAGRAAFAFNPLETVSLDAAHLERATLTPAAALLQDEKARLEALAAVDKIYSAQPERTFEFESVSIVPTDALFVESELGDCLICEPYVVAKHKLELDRLRLENKKLEREIELLQEYKDYRCCDDEEVEDEGDESDE